MEENNISARVSKDQNNDNDRIKKKKKCSVVGNISLLLENLYCFPDRNTINAKSFKDEQDADYPSMWLTSSKTVNFLTYG